MFQRVLVTLSILAVCSLAVPEAPSDSNSDNGTHDQTPEWDEKDLTLRHVLALSRHGDRAPWGGFQTYDHWNFWKQGPGSLTTLGMEQHYSLGQFLRSRYPGLLQPDYFPWNFKAYGSEEASRCQVSAQAQVAAMYPPKGWEVFRAGLDWQPIAVFDADSFIWPATDYRVCQTAYDMINLIYANETYRAIAADNQDLLDLLSQSAGQPVDLDLSLIPVADTYFCDSCHNLTLPAFLDHTNFTRMVSLLNIVLEAQFSTTFLQQVHISRLFHKIGNILESVVDEKSNNQFSIIVGHDTDIAATQMALGSFEDWPPYAAAFILETYEDMSTHQFFIKGLYRNTSGDDLYEQTFPFCNASLHHGFCRFDDFMHHLSGFVIDVKKACVWSDETTHALAVNVAVDSIYVMVGVLFLLALFVCSRKGRVPCGMARCMAKEQTYANIGFSYGDTPEKHQEAVRKYMGVH